MDTTTFFCHLGNSPVVLLGIHMSFCVYCMFFAHTVHAHESMAQTFVVELAYVSID